MHSEWHNSSTGVIRFPGEAVMCDIRSRTGSLFVLFASIAIAAVAHLEGNHQAHGEMRCSPRVGRHRVIGVYRTEVRAQSIVEIPLPDEAKPDGGLKRANASKIAGDVKAA